MIHSTTLSQLHILVVMYLNRPEPRSLSEFLYRNFDKLVPMQIHLFGYLPRHVNVETTGNVFVIFPRTSFSMY